VLTFCLQDNSLLEKQSFYLCIISIERNRIKLDPKDINLVKHLMGVRPPKFAPDIAFVTTTAEKRLEMEIPRIFRRYKTTGLVRSY